MSPPSKELSPLARYLVAMRPEGSAAEAEGTARVLGLAPEQVKDVFGAGWPRIIASRSTREEAEGLARVLVARGREAVAWDRESPLVELFHAESLLVEGDRLVLERRGQGHRTYPADKIQRLIDVRLRPGAQRDGAGDSWLRAKASPTVGQGGFPDRALLIVPVSGWSQPGVLSTRSVVTEPTRQAPLLAAQRVQAAFVQARAHVPDKVLEMRTHPSALGVDETGGEPLERVLQLLARLPPTPALPSTDRGP